METALFTEPRFNNYEAAREHHESIRWPDGAVCPHCGGTERNSLLQGESTRAGFVSAVIAALKSAFILTHSMGWPLISWMQRIMKESRSNPRGIKFGSVS